MHKAAFLFLFFCLCSLLSQESPEYPQKYKDSLKLYLAGDFKASLQNIRSIFEQTKFQFPLRMLAASNYSAMRNYKAAKKHIRAAVKNYPKRFEPIVLYSRVLRKQRKYRQAVAAAARGIQKIADTPSLRMEIAASYYALKRYKKAHRQIQKTLELDPKNYYAFYMDALIFLKEGNYEAAEFRLRNTLALSPKEERNILAIYNNLGFSLEKKGDAFANSGNTAQAKNSYTEANLYYSYALAVSPQNPVVQANKKRIGRK